MDNEFIPPHLNLKKLNPDINLACIPAKIPLELIEWKRRSGKPRIAGVSSFGITGTDAHVIIQEPPQNLLNTTITIESSREVKLFTISGRSIDSLTRQLKVFYDYVNNGNESLELGDIEYTLHTPRSHLSYRLPIMASTKEELLKE